MNKDVAQKIERIAESIEISFNIYNTEIINDLLELALTAFPDSYHDNMEGLAPDLSWSWCWEELSSDAQDYVKEIRSLINLFLKWKKE